ncbi:Predicted oxidoreductase, contains short-chain dehydrogenase (SDR) and DUF2520 domains [Marivirga sericea]|uniref:Predicted oxidoreductase, contains short-chain dehydrogenase (SDR) and DUF2520 domains n=1 Tax=Marivirga sericea TaxID=1028 RepID=A0A1X7KQX2_9BACT|nr:Rossmann-like and DUF2520 domain-containing protein [Marivirga sericea]SMG43689.1 Predicted oxidoreductase, contains short-chain dehydrogenase (SDR) and DUF2520 domains [Marivirga sericea]
MKNVAYHISFIGAGNVAWHLAAALENVGHFVKEVYSPDGKSAKKLVGNLYDASVKTDLNFTDSPSQIFILAVPDDTIKSIAHEIALPEQSLMVHTSGSKGLDALEFSTAAATGVFYPLQTFSKSKTLDFQHLPFLLESENKEALKILNNLAKSLSKNTQIVSTVQRKQMHLAAVFACNFTNHMMSISEKIMNNAKLDFSLLHPLVLETIDKALKHSPKSVQTGPAKRGDLETLDKHMEMLQNDEAAQEMYRLISQSILDNQE